LASDYDLWLRLLEKHELCNLPETLLSYRQHDASDSARHRTQLMIEHVLAMQSSEYRRQGKVDPIADKELTLELLLSLFDPSQPSAYMWAKFLVFRSIDGRGRLLYDALAKILRYASSTRQTNEMIDLLGSYLNTKETLRIAQIFAEMPELYDEPDHSAVTHAIASLSQRRAGESSN
jgi:hypothetical protein